MEPLLERAIQEADLADIACRILQGEHLRGDDLARLRRSDVLLAAALADAFRARYRGGTVLLLRGEPSSCALDAHTVEVDLDPVRGITGQEALVEVSMARLSVPAKRGIAVCWNALGVELAQTALLFGADVLWGGVGRPGGLPLVGQGSQAELEGLVERAGRSPRWHSAPCGPEERL